MNGPHLNIFAPTISTYGRIVAMAAEEAGLSWDIVPTDKNDPSHLNRHPFRKTPAVEIGDLMLFESVAICQYLDEEYNKSRLQPSDPLLRARMTQWISVANTYLFPTSEYGLVMPRLIVPMMGREPREDIIEQELPKIAYQMSVVSSRLEESSYLAGPDYSLADLFTFGILRAVEMTPEGRMILSHLLPLKHWMARCAQRRSVCATSWPGEDSLEASNTD